MSHSASHNPKDAKASLDLLPLETLLQILRYICSDWIYSFDAVARAELANPRLVSRRFSRAATPLLFGSVIFDEKFLQPQQLSRGIDFARENPELANLVKRIQFKVSPPIYRTRTSSLTAYYVLSKCCELGMLEDNAEKQKWVHKVVLGPFREWAQTIDRLAMGKTQASADRYMASNPEQDGQDAIWLTKFLQHDHPAFEETVQALPNLSHVEIRDSSWYVQHYQSASEAFRTQFSGRIDLMRLVPPFPGPVAPKAPGYLSEFVPPNLQSLKLVNQSFEYDGSKPVYWAQSVRHLTHLDLECEVRSDLFFGVETKWLWSEWAAILRHNLQNLPHLRILRLTQKEWSHTISRLLDPLSDDRAPCYFDEIIGDCKWEHLESLSLAHWPMRESALSDLIVRHAESLKSVEFGRLSLLRTKHSRNRADAWQSIVAACSPYPKLKLIVLSQITTHWWTESGTEDIFEERGATGRRSLVLYHVNGIVDDPPKC